jgi:hypothetical protein
MRRVVADQIKALNELSALVSRSNRAIDSAPPIEPARREPPPAPPGTPAPGHARPDDDLGTEMPELPPEAFPDPSPNPFRGDPAPPSEEHPTARPPHPLIMMERRSVDAGWPSARHDAW